MNTPATLEEMKSNVTVCIKEMADDMGYVGGICILFGKKEHLITGTGNVAENYIETVIEELQNILKHGIPKGQNENTI